MLLPYVIFIPAETMIRAMHGMDLHGYKLVLAFYLQHDKIIANREHHGKRYKDDDHPKVILQAPRACP